VKKDLLLELSNRKVIAVLSSVSTETKPGVSLFVLKELQLSFNRDVAREGNEEIRESNKN